MIRVKRVAGWPMPWTQRGAASPLRTTFNGVPVEIRSVPGRGYVAVIKSAGWVNNKPYRTESGAIRGAMRMVRLMTGAR